MSNSELFAGFTNRYSLSKTLRFELKPIGKDGKPLTEQEAVKVFEKILEQDRKIKKAYDALKPVMDKIHESIINISLTSEEAKKIDFSAYNTEYHNGKEKKLDSIEKALRENIGKTFEKAANEFAQNAGDDEKGKRVFKKKKDKDVGVEYLTQAGILKYIENNIKKLVPEEKVKEFIDKKEVTNTKGKKGIERTGHLEVFGSFFTYFSGYNQNRENYYVIEKEADTAVATRIIHVNLPKFCDNAIQFENRKNDYTGALQFLQNNNRTTQIKDAATNTMIVAEAISEKWFKIEKFSECLTQAGIGEYNKIIGHYNLLINLYNQAIRDEKKIKKLERFRTLFKQIGSGEKRVLFEEIKNDDELKSKLKTISETGKKYFEKPAQENDITTIHNFIEFLKQTEDWNGIYWSKSAVDKVSNQFLANWYSIKERIEAGLQSKEQKESLKSVASYDKKREEQLKINDAVELSGLFAILNQEAPERWSKIFFKNSILEESNLKEKKSENTKQEEATPKYSIDEKKLTPSQNLINLICADIEEQAKAFCDKSDGILKITDYKNEDNILTIKEWLDTAKSLLWLVKYFEVKESKVKGNSINPELTNMLSDLLRADDADWFDWYDLIRNYLSKKPQDDAKKNKLKLNFLNPNLLGGWSDGQEKNKGAVLLKNGNKQYVGLLIERNVFDTEKSNNPVYSEMETGAGRLILRNLKFQTLAGKGFLSKYGESYGTIGQTNPNDAVTKLQTFIAGNYVQKYPLLKEVSEKTYTDKRTFDEAIKNALTECYECNFTPINWDGVLKFVEENKLYLFELYSKDFSENKGDKSKNSNVNLQTKYWEHLFEDNSTIQLNGGGEVFYREKVELKDEDKAIHHAKITINRRSDGKKESVFNHEIVKNKRFTENKFFFHIPIKINYQAPLPGIRDGKPNSQAVKAVNELVNDQFIQANDIQFLGIDRGEKHLIYYSLVDANGNIKENGQGHFDIINKKDYLTEINEAAKKRREKQENWQQKGNISNLKDGYISLVVHEIIQKMKDKDGNYKPTFIIMEDLNTGFKRSRQKFEQQVYQKFELALAKKLNYLVDKSITLGQIGSVSQALQLTPPVANYGDIENRKQVGIMLYTRANYTSVTDPATGWRKTIYLKTGSEETIKKQIFDSFTEIRIENGDYFFQYTDANGKVWKLWSSKNGKALERYRAKRGKDKNQYIVESFDVKEILDQLFVDFDKTKSLKTQFKENVKLKKVNEQHTALESLRFVIDIIQQIRNSGDTTKKQEDNFLLSPVRNEQGEHFDSRKSGNTLPIDADANGAYNIARKGIIMYEHIKQWIKDGKQKYEKFSDLDLFIPDKEWDLWVSDKEQWKKQVQTFASKKIKKEQPPKIRQ